MLIRLRPPALELFCTQSSLGKIGKEEPWTLEIISYWSDKLSSILDYFTFDPQKKYFTNSAQKSGVICLSRPRIPARLRVPKSSLTTSPSPHVPASPNPHVPESPRPRVPKSHFPRPRPTFSNSPRQTIMTRWTNLLTTNKLTKYTNETRLQHFNENSTVNYFNLRKLTRSTSDVTTG